MLLLLAALFTGLTSCGGGGSGSSQPTQDFTLTPSASSLSLQQLAGGVAYSVAINPVNEFSGSVSITFLNLPTGITTVPAGPYTASPGQPLNIALAASQAAAIGNSTITVEGHSGNLTHTTNLAISVTAAVTFQLNLSPAMVNIGPNGEASTQITLVPGSNFGDNSVFLQYPSVHVGDTGVDMNVSPQFLTAAQPQATISFQSRFEVQAGSGIHVPITGSVGEVVVDPDLSLDIVNPAPPCTKLSRSTTRRTDMDPTGVVYDPVHKLVFAAIQQLNALQVYSSTDTHHVATIDVPAPRNLDITPDGSRILVGSLMRYMSWVDTSSLQVIGQVPAVSGLFNGSIPPAPMRPVILASGKALVEIGAGAPLEWDPATNTWTDPTPPAFAPGDVILRRSADHTKVVVAPVQQNSLAIFDSASDSYGPVQNITATAAALNSNGSRIAVIVYSPTIPGGHQVTLFDKHFNVLATYPLNAETVPSDLIFSRDDSLVYVLTLGGYAVALHATDLSFAGTLPNPGTGGGADYPPDIDETGMILSPGNGLRSVVFTDASAPCAVGVNTPYNMSLSPPQGVPNAPSPTVLSAVGGITGSSQVYFGAAPGSPQATPGTNLIPNPPTSIQVTPPPAQGSGAVNVTVTNPDGSLGIVYDGFSYGSNVLAVTSTSGPATGATSSKIYGYGLAFDKSQIQVTVGGNPAVVTNAFAGPGISPFPFPMDQVTFTTPAGPPGPADVVITTPAGSSTVSNGFQYLQNLQTFPISGTLVQVVYDQLRQRLYAGDYATNKVYVFDLIGQKYLTPITVGNSPQGLALTPDFSTLVVSNGPDSSISIIDLTGGTGTKTVSLSNLPGLPDQCGPPFPYAVATTSKNQAVIAIGCINVTAGEYIVLDLATHAVGCGNSSGCAAMVAAYPQNLDYILALAGTTDGSRIFLLNGIVAGLWDVTSDTFTSQPSGDVTLRFPIVQTAAAADGTAFAVVFGITDPMMYKASIMQDVDYLLVGSSRPMDTFGEKLHPSGALLYTPQSGGFDMYDAHHGHIRRRVALPLQIPETYDAMALDETGARVFLITTSGLAVVDVGDLPLSVGSLSPAEGSASGGVSVQIRGSGFKNGATVMFGSSEAVVSVVDSSTLQATTPSLPVGAARITVVNPDGTRYTLDDAFTAN